MLLGSGGKGGLEQVSSLVSGGRSPLTSSDMSMLSVSVKQMPWNWTRFGSLQATRAIFNRYHTDFARCKFSKVGFPCCLPDDAINRPLYLVCLSKQRRPEEDLMHQRPVCTPGSALLTVKHVQLALQAGRPMHCAESE